MAGGTLAVAQGSDGSGGGCQGGTGGAADAVSPRDGVLPARLDGGTAHVHVLLSAMARRKLIEFDPETWTALEELASDRMATIQELADEAFADLLRKHGRPVGLKQSLKESAGPRAAKRRSRPTQ